LKNLKGRKLLGDIDIDIKIDIKEIGCEGMD
jgi:hypothetical protein